jgi:hypothetical protein
MLSGGTVSTIKDRVALFCCSLFCLHDSLLCLHDSFIMPQKLSFLKNFFKKHVVTYAKMVFFQKSFQKIRCHTQKLCFFQKLFSISSPKLSKIIFYFDSPRHNIHFLHMFHIFLHVFYIFVDGNRLIKLKKDTFLRHNRLSWRHLGSHGLMSPFGP